MVRRREITGPCRIQMEKRTKTRVMMTGSTVMSDDRARGLGGRAISSVGRERHVILWLVTQNTIP